MKMTLESFHEKFFQTMFPYWKMYAGTRIGRTPLAKNLNQDEATENIDESWELLQKAFSWHTSGVFTVLLLSSPSAKNDSGVVSTIQVGAGNPGLGATSGQMNMGGQMQQMMQMFSFFQKMNSGPDVAAIEARIEQKYQILKLQEDLENSGMLSAKEQMIEGLANAIPQAINGLFGVPMMPQQTQIGIAGQEAVTSEAAAKNPVPGGHKLLDLNRLAQFAGAMQRRYPNFYINDLLDAFYLYAKDNPQMADQVVQTIIKHAQTRSAPQSANVQS